MALDNVAVCWPRTGRFYDPVPPAEFVDFAEVAERRGADGRPALPNPTIALAAHVAKTGSVHASGYTQLVDLILGLDGVLSATEASAEDEDPVIDPDGCAWIAGGLERFVAGHRPYGEDVTFDTVAEVLRDAVAGARLAEQQLKWINTRLDALRDADGTPPQWNFSLTEIAVLGMFYRRCADRGFAVFADL